MADLDLRALARAAEARPGDRAAGWAYASALARAGDRRGQARELCRLARLGDPDAQQALDAWSPWPGPGGLVRRRSLARAPRSLVERARVSLGRHQPALLGVSRDVALIGLREGGFEARHLVDGALRWGCRESELLALVGDLVVAAHGSQLVAREVISGEVLERATLPGEVLKLVPVAGGRAICVFGPTFGLVDLVPGALGQRAWELPFPPGGRLSAGGSFVLVETGERTAARGLQLVQADSGAVLWTRHAWGLERGEPGLVLTVDRRGLIAWGITVRSGLADADAWLVELDPLSRAPRWSHVRRGGVTALQPGLVAVDERLVVTATSGDAGGGPGRLLAIERATGHQRWTWPLRDGAPTLALTPTALWLGERGCDDRGAPGVRVTALDRATGEPRLSHTIVDAPGRLHFAPCDGGGVLLCDDALIVLGEG